ncbi:hypothetical protein MLD38_024167 [Melastoma candidum]|uniref:Uncharacterized protein n=1 Tax=Melastoma candidum TaxID=119954 RepID=A0ACB9NRU8_9MYRT|nr:hypothetical protein MLD38_024167 [Melastoma candidum]
MKRSIGGVEFKSVSSMAAHLMLLSRGHEYAASSDHNTGFSSRVFECKTCSRQFMSFQALGGHRASHKKPRTAAGVGVDGRNESSTAGQSPPRKPKTHECSVCGQEFSIGQALGGHMRRHRATALGVSPDSHDDDSNVELTLSSTVQRVDLASVQIPVVKKSSSGKVLWWDLNLTPTENDWKLDEMLKPTAPIFCYL